MALDFIGLTLVILFFIRGYMKGAVVALFSVIAVIVGVVCAMKLSGTLAAWLLKKGIITSGWGQLISYALLFFGVLLLVKLIAGLIDKSLKISMLGWLNGLIGGLLYVFMASVVWSSVLWLLNQMHILSPEMLVASRTYSWFSPLAPWAFEQVGRLLPFAKDIFSDLEHFFDQVNQNLPDNVGADR
jgi:membrane protein required for colicin V production